MDRKMDRTAAHQVLERITQFRDLYVELLAAQQAGHSALATQCLMQLARLSSAVQRDLDRLGPVGRFILHDAPALGGTQYEAGLANLVIHGDLAAQYHVKPSQILLLLEAAIGEYERLREDTMSPQTGPGTATDGDGQDTGDHTNAKRSRRLIALLGAIAVVGGIVIGAVNLLGSLTTVIQGWDPALWERIRAVLHQVVGM